MTAKIILPGNYNQPVNRDKMIERFLKDWLTEKQLKGMGGWYTEMLDAFMTEVLLHARETGIEKLLLQRSSGNVIEGMLGKMRSRHEGRFPLAIVSQEPKKPKIAQVTVEEVGGDLASEAKTIPLSEVKTYPSDVDVRGSC